MEQYLDNPSNMTRFQSKLINAMRDPQYVTHGNHFDWNRFAYEFTAPDFDPPLDTLRLFDFVLTPHFSRSWRYLPRDRVWWLIRLVIDVPYPLFWLQKRQLQGHRGEMTRLAKKLNCFAITAQSLSNYLTRRRPNVPKQFQIVDMPLLVLLETQPSSVWGIEHRLFKTRLVKKVAFCEPLEQQLFRYQVTRGEQSLETKVKGMLEQYNFKPQITLFFTSRTVNRHTGRLIWGRLTVEQKEQMADLTSGPMLVQEWDEDGWPMGYRVPLE